MFVGTRPGSGSEHAEDSDDGDLRLCRHLGLTNEVILEPSSERSSIGQVEGLDTAGAWAKSNRTSLRIDVTRMGATQAKSILSPPTQPSQASS